MIRSSFAITRLLVLPYIALLALYLLVVGGGGAWLYLAVREAETRILIDELQDVLATLVAKLSSTNAVTLMANESSWLQTDVKRLFAELPELREVSVRSPDRGFRMTVAESGNVATLEISPLTEDALRAGVLPPAVQRLFTLTDRFFWLRFDLSRPDEPPVRLDFGFSRAELLAQVNAATNSLKQAILLFGLVGGVSLLIAFVITVVAARTTRRMEGYFQEIYRRASITQVAAELVHDLRNPLMAIRTNVKALLVSPTQTREIVTELDRDIVALNDKLTGFLSFTRSHDAAFEPTDLQALIEDAIRLSEPILAKQGLGIELKLEPALPPPDLQAQAIRDALVNVLVNAAQSGQTAGNIRIRACATDGVVTIAVEDRGKGIAPADLPRMFDAFYTTKADGNGLGLAIVRHIVESHHGRVTAQNRRAGGARITITLPLKQPEVPRWWKAHPTPSRT